MSKLPYLVEKVMMMMKMGLIYLGCLIQTRFMASREAMVRREVRMLEKSKKEVFLKIQKWKQILKLKKSLMKMSLDLSGEKCSCKCGFWILNLTFYISERKLTRRSQKDCLLRIMKNWLYSFLEIGDNVITDYYLIKIPDLLKSKDTIYLHIIKNSCSLNFVKLHSVQNSQLMLVVHKVR